MPAPFFASCLLIFISFSSFSFLFYFFTFFAHKINYFFQNFKQLALISDRPRCRSNQKLVYGTEIQQQIRVLCDVDSNPPPVRFFWSFSRTGSDRVRSASLSTNDASLANSHLSSLPSSSSSPSSLAFISLQSTFESWNDANTPSLIDHAQSSHLPSSFKSTTTSHSNFDSYSSWSNQKQSSNSSIVLNSNPSNNVPPFVSSIVLTHFTSSAHRSSLLYTPKTLDDFGQLSCESENSVGRQTFPCVFTVIPAGKLSTKYYSFCLHLTYFNL